MEVQGGSFKVQYLTLRVKLFSAPSFITVKLIVTLAPALMFTFLLGTGHYLSPGGGSEYFCCHIGAFT